LDLDGLRFRIEFPVRVFCDPYRLTGVDPGPPRSKLSLVRFPKLFSAFRSLSRTRVFRYSSPREFLVLFEPLQ